MLSIILSLAFASDLPPDLGVHNYRCTFVSASHKIVHHFTVPKDHRKLCEYGIKVDEQIVLVEKAFGDDCQEFMQKQMNKGSVCMTNAF